MLWASLGDYWVKNTSCFSYLNLVQKQSKIWTSGSKCGQQEEPLQIPVVLLLSFSKKLDLIKKKKESKSCSKLLCHTWWHPTFPGKRDLTAQLSSPVEVLVKSHKLPLGHPFPIFSVSCSCTAANDTAVRGECELVFGKVFCPLTQINPVPQGSEAFWDKVDKVAVSACCDWGLLVSCSCLAV